MQSPILQSKSVIVPSPLKPGDLLRVIAPSGALREYETFEAGVEIWRSRGYKIEIVSLINDRWGYLAGKDESRRSNLAEAWQDSECKGILCARGGFGATRLLEKWNWQSSQNSDLNVSIPKWLIGFSDITALLWSLYKEGISGVHAPVLTTLAKEPKWSVDRLFDWVEGRSLKPLEGKAWGGGIVSGKLLPANLTVATHLLGTPMQPDLEGAILAIEDVSEAPYRIDRMLTQWRMSGYLSQIKGIAVGRFSQCEPPAKIPSFSVNEVLEDRLSDLNIPVVSNLPFGHDGCNAALPVGIPVQLDGDKGVLSF
ncbi:MAG: LD-carboxypeptidase, partial [Cyanobacteria bacterium P01_A01_bin.45]